MAWRWGGSWGALVLLIACSSSSPNDAGVGDASATVGAQQEFPCRTSLDCRDAPNDALICDPQTQSCAQCVSNTDCDADEECAASVCTAVMRCEDSLDCPLGLVCDAASSRCVQCAADADCDAGSVCAGAVCRPACASDRACTPDGLLCNRDLGHCVACFVDADCPSGNGCNAGACVAVEQPPITSGCPEGQKSCGGSCVPQTPAVGCGLAICEPCPQVENGSPVCNEADCDVACNPGFAKNGTACLPAPAECGDGVQSPGETDVDCGGTQCGKCPNGGMCQVDEDCAVTACVSNRCQSSQCSNGNFDPGETDVDCGGLDCPKCPPGAVCERSADCDSGRCLTSSSLRCAEPSCTDFVRNGNEVGTDCGGPDCPKCPDGQACREPGGCMSGLCVDSVCRPVTCGNGVMDEFETDIDCGGLALNPLGTSCATCRDGAMCLMATDCRSSVCTGSVCQAPTCGDMATNGTETGTDCGGGACPPCPLGRACRTTADCAEGECVTGYCRTRCPAAGAATCPVCLIPTFVACCRADGYCGCGILTTCGL